MRLNEGGATRVALSDKSSVRASNREIEVLMKMVDEFAGKDTKPR